MSDLISIVGLLAAFLSTISMFPQIARVWRTKSASDVSGGMFLIMVVSVSIWLTYGLLSSDLPIVASNIVVFGQAVTMLSFKRKFGKPPFSGV